MATTTFRNTPHQLQRILPEKDYPSRPLFSKQIVHSSPRDSLRFSTQSSFIRTKTQHFQRECSKLRSNPRIESSHSDTNEGSCAKVNTQEELLWSQNHNFTQRVKNVALSAALAVAIGLGGCCGNASAIENEALTITFPGSTNKEVSTVQKTMVETWGIIHETYVDSTFNHQDWERQLSDGLADTMRLHSTEDVYGKIRSMLASLGDPFTRFVTPKEYESFRIGNDGAVEGVGLLIAADPTSGRLVVLNPIEGGPAARAGIHAGDELVQIDDVNLQGLDGEEAAVKLRGRAGTSVTLTLRRSSSVSQAGAEAPPVFTEVRLKREMISLSPVFSAMLPHTGDSGDTERTGYIRLSAFSQNATEDMEAAIERLEEKGAGNFILDLRNNPGGLVRAGLEIASMWLDGRGTLVNTIDRAGHMQAISLTSGSPLTRRPLAILVNGGSASASEIVAGALHDNGRATLIGDTTYGKGKIQSVFELEDGSALFVTVAKYLSPHLHEIDHVGIAPDLQCMPDGITAVAAKRPVDIYLDTSSEEGNLQAASVLQTDACVLTAERQLDVL